jgi:hypothetical protein
METAATPIAAVSRYQLMGHMSGVIDYRELYNAWTFWSI